MKKTDWTSEPQLVMTIDQASEQTSQTKPVEPRPVIDGPGQLKSENDQPVMDNQAKARPIVKSRQPIETN